MATSIGTCKGAVKSPVSGGHFDAISFRSPHVRCTPMWALSTCGEPNETKKNTHPEGVAARPAYVGDARPGRARFQGGADAVGVRCGGLHLVLGARDALAAVARALPGCCFPPRDIALVRHTTLTHRANHGLDGVSVPAAPYYAREHRVSAVHHGETQAKSRSRRGCGTWQGA